MHESIPREDGLPDTSGALPVAIIGAVVFVLEFKVGETEFTSAAIDQVWDYALDLKNFHEPSHGVVVVPVVPVVVLRLVVVVVRVQCKSILPSLQSREVVAAAAPETRAIPAALVDLLRRSPLRAEEFRA